MVKMNCALMRATVSAGPVGHGAGAAAFAQEAVRRAHAL
jgi:hypothetical protein